VLPTMSPISVPIDKLPPGPDLLHFATVELSSARGIRQPGRIFRKDTLPGESCVEGSRTGPAALTLVIPGFRILCIIKGLRAVNY